MIRHWITHPKNKYQSTPPPSTHSWYDRFPNQGSAYMGNIPAQETKPRMSKLEFANHIRDMGFKVGDFVVRKGATAPYGPMEVNQITYIEEMLPMIAHNEWDSEGWPRCYHIRNFHGAQNNTFWKSSLDFAKPNALLEDEIPPAWKAYLQDQADKDKRAQDLANDFS